MTKIVVFLCIITHVLCASDATQNITKIALCAPALEKDNHVHKGTIDVRNKNLRILFPPCDSFEQREKYAGLMGILLYRRDIKHVFNLTTTQGIVVSPHISYSFKIDTFTEFKKHHYIDTNILEDVTNFLASRDGSRTENYVPVDHQWESLQPENPSGMRLLIYFKDNGDAACIDPENDCLGFEQIDVPNRLKLEDFKKLKDALTKLYNHGDSSQDPQELDVQNLRLIYTMLKSHESVCK